MEKTDTKSPTRSVERSLDIIECFSKEDSELSLTDISRKTALSLTTVTRLVSTLSARGYLVRNDENRKYFLGPTVARLGAAWSANIDLRKLALKHMRSLRDKCGEDVSLYIVNGKIRTCIERVSGTYQLRRIVNIGDSLPLNVGAPGKLLLAHAGAALQEEILAESPHLGMSELLYIKAAGYTFAHSLSEVGLASIAAPVFNSHGNVVAALSIAGPLVRYVDTDLTQKISWVREAACDISRDSGWTC